MKKEIRKEIRFSEEEYKLFTEVQEKLSLNTFADFIRYSINYFLKDEKSEEYNRKICQQISKKLDLNKELLLKYMKIIAKSQIEMQLNYLKDLERRKEELEEIYYGIDELERSNQIIKGGRLNEKRN